jgi:DNA-binding transcriptional regulator YdaS (Cro superfamily)
MDIEKKRAIVQAAWLDWLSQLLNCRNDAALCRRLGVAPPQVSKVRHGRLPVGAAMLLAAHRATNMPVMLLEARL